MDPAKCSEMETEIKHLKEKVEKLDAKGDVKGEVSIRTESKVDELLGIVKGSDREGDIGLVGKIDKLMHNAVTWPVLATLVVTLAAVATLYVTLSGHVVFK